MSLPSVIQQRNLPGVMGALSGMVSPDYMDLFTANRPIAALIWVPASAVHRRLMPGLLHGTVRRQAGLSEM